ncbi:RTA1 like protein-domain-containing protein, partial [Leptodontidium sp. 2 PMI_412]
IAPVFLTAVLYLTFSRVLLCYPAQYSRFSPATYTIIFICSDIIALILQATGGALAATTTNPANVQIGTNIMVIGLSFQVACLIAFTLFCADILLSIKARRRFFFGTAFPFFSSSALTYRYLGMAAATILILIRSSFRVAELAHGFQSRLANDQVTFILLEGGGGTISTAAILLTIFPPASHIYADLKTAYRPGEEAILLQTAEGFSPPLN